MRRGRGRPGCGTMNMSVLERRVQILVERAQYERLEKIAATESRSVASLIRDAITAYLDSGGDSRIRALDLLLEMTPDEGAGEDWGSSKKHLEMSGPQYP
jgi:predicted DNA-binding protein